jgi:uncharacterized protein YcnI
MLITRSHVQSVLAGLAAIVGAIALVMFAGPAAAHTGTTASPAPEGRTLVTYTFSHGCSGAPTIGLRAQLPAGASSVVASNPSGWSSTVTSTEVHWTGPEIADGVSAQFNVAMVLAQPAGSTVVMPNIQECSGGAELAWIGAPSSDTSESSRPAPTIVVPANASAAPVTTVSPSVTVTVASGEARMSTDANAVTEEGSAQSDAGRIVFFGACAAIVIGAGVLFLKNRRRSATN